MQASNRLYISSCFRVPALLEFLPSLNLMINCFTELFLEKKKKTNQRKPSFLPKLLLVMVRHHISRHPDCQSLCLCHNGLWTVSWNISLTNDWCGKLQLNVVVTPGQMNLDCIRKHAEQALKSKTASSSLPWHLRQFHQWWTVTGKCKPNRPLSLLVMLLITTM